MTATLDVITIQQALDALVTGDDRGAAVWISQDVVLTGVGGCVDGRTAGLVAVLGCFAEMSRMTDGTFGTEVEGVYHGAGGLVATLTRHWARHRGTEVRATQVLLLGTAGALICSIDALSGPGPPSGIWD